MSLRKNILPAGNTLHAKESFPIVDSNCHFVHLRRGYRPFSSASRDCFRSTVILASIVTVSKCMPRNVIDVDGPSIFDVLTGALIF